MNISRIGSVIKKAALYVPRRIANSLRGTKIGFAPIQNMPSHYAKISVKGNQVEEVRVYKKVSPSVTTINVIANSLRPNQLKNAPPIAKGMLDIESERIGPFAVTAQSRWALHDQLGYFGEPLPNHSEKRMSKKELLAYVRKAIKYNWAMDREMLEVAKGVMHIEDEATGPFTSTAQVKPKITILDRFIGWLRK